jgi:hypothetical protein
MINKNKTTNELARFEALADCERNGRVAPGSAFLFFSRHRADILRGSLARRPGCTETKGGNVSYRPANAVAPVDRHKVRPAVARPAGGNMAKARVTPMSRDRKNTLETLETQFSSLLSQCTDAATRAAAAAKKSLCEKVAFLRRALGLAPSADDDLRNVGRFDRENQ